MVCILYRDLAFYRKVSFFASLKLSSFPGGPVVKTGLLI